VCAILLCRGLVDKSGEQFVAYFLPTEETLRKRRRDEQHEIDYDADDEYDFKLAREYTWTIKSKINSGYEENFCFLMRDKCVYYNELETR
jgi:RNA polymerase II-associated factor 1